MGKSGTGKRTIPLVLAIVLWPGFTNADLISDGVSDSEIRIGNIMPYTGPLAAFGAIGRAEAAYFDRVNENGGINGRKVKFISYDDSSNPVTAVEKTQELVETDKVLLMFGSFGTPSNLATRNYLNTKETPQLS
jgi:ABC-type branched-subunit amino acid transport system substrate-binding protein